MERRFDLADGTRRRAGIEVGLVDDDQVGELHHALLDRLQVVAGVGQLQQHEHVGHRGHRGFALADADGLDDDDAVARGLDDADRVARRRRDAAERAAARARPNERAAVDREVLHARLVAEDRAPRDARARIDREHGDAPAGADELQAEGLDEGRLADAGNARDADPKRRPRRLGQRGEERVGALAMIDAGRFEQRDRLGDGAPLALARSGEHRGEHVLITGRQHRDAAAPRGARRASA